MGDLLSHNSNRVRFEYNILYIKTQTWTLLGKKHVSITGSLWQVSRRICNLYHSYPECHYWYGTLKLCMGWTFVRISWLSLWLFCRFLSGCPVVMAGTENRKEPQGLSELVQTQRVHDVIWGSGTAVSHCVIVYSLLHLWPVFWCCWKGARSQACLLPCWWIPFFTQTHIQSVCSLEQSEVLQVTVWLKHTHSFPLCSTAMYTRKVFHCPEWTHKQSDIAKGPMYILFSPNDSYFSPEFSIPMGAVKQPLTLYYLLFALNSSLTLN